MHQWLIRGLLFACLAWASPALAFGPCDSTTYVSNFRGAGLSNTCRVVSVETLRYSGGSAPIRLLAVEGEGSVVNEDALKLVFRRLANRASEALTALPGLRVNEVSVLITRQSPPPQAGLSRLDAWAQTYVENGECFITQFWPRESTTRDYFMFLIAHEIFHCVQRASEFAATRAEESDWWVEGTAEYFANLTYPGTSFSDGYVGDFDLQSQRRPLNRMTYASVVFFFWLAQQDGPSAIVRFIRGMAEGGGGLAAMQAQIPATAWHDFGQAYLDAEIVAPGARPVPTSPTTGRLLRINGPTRPRVRTAPFVLHRERWTFVAGRVYQVEQTMIDAGMAVSFRQSETKWTGPPERVLACDEQQVFFVLATTTTEPGEARYEVTLPERLQNATACCMVGAWTPTDESRAGENSFFQDIGGPAIAAQGGSTECDAPINDWTLDFGADGRGTLDWNDFSMRCSAGRPGQGRLTATSTRSGRINFEWTSEHEGAAVIRHLDRNMTMHIDARVGRMVMMDQTRPYPPPTLEYNPIAVTCRRNELRVEGLYTLGHRSETHVRMTPATPPP